MAYYGCREWLKELRMNKGYSQSMLAAICEMTQTSYANIELGYRKASRKYAEKIAAALGFPIERFEEEDEKAARRAAG